MSSLGLRVVPKAKRLIFCHLDVSSVFSELLSAMHLLCDPLSPVSEESDFLMIRCHVKWCSLQEFQRANMER